MLTYSKSTRYENAIILPVFIPGIGHSSADRRYNVREAELADWRDLLHHVVAEELFFWNESARVAGDHGDWARRVDVVAGEVAVAVGRVRVDGVRLRHEVAHLQRVVVTVHLVDLDARVRQRADDL